MVNHDYWNTNVARTINTNVIIGRSYDVKVDIFQNDCTTPITDIGFTVSKVTRWPKYPNWDNGIQTVDLAFESLEIEYSVDPINMLTNSSIWNGLTWNAEVCQVLRLVTPANETHMAVTETEDLWNLNFAHDPRPQGEISLVPSSSIVVILSYILLSLSNVNTGCVAGLVSSNFNSNNSSFSAREI